MKRKAYRILVLGLAVFATPVGAEEHSVPDAAMSEETAPSPNSEELSASGGDPVSKVIAPVWPPVTADIRALYALQDAAANGHSEAALLQRAMLGQINRKLETDMASADPSLLVESVAGFILSGGNPSHAEALATRSGVSGFDRRLLRGAAFYMLGKRQEAAVEWSQLETTQLKPHLAGRVALAQAMLETEDHDRRQHLLSLAMALMPGSLVEESALRRSALSYAERNSQNRFWWRAERYLRRFPRSLYSREFLYTLMDSVVNFEKASPKADLQKVERFLNMVPMAKRRTLYLHLTRQASLGNLVDLTKFAARRALRLSADGSQEAQLAALYNSIYEVVSVDTEQASATLRKLNPNLLPALERKLLAASLAVTDEIRKPAEMERADAIIPAGEDLTSDITRVADTALSKADEMIGTSLQ